MLVKINTLAQKIRAFLEPSAWMIRLLGLSKPAVQKGQRGLILIQIDGLSHSRFHEAIKRGRLPFMKRLREKEHYAVHHHYSGLPSSTPSIQAELFYGEKQFVPAFKFRDHETQKIFTFYDSSTAEAVESRLAPGRSGLLCGGSSYSNIFAGGSKENAHFCVSTAGWNAFFQALNPWSLLVLVVFNLAGVLRLLFYSVVEFFLALADSIHGMLKGYGFKEEFLFILSRLIVTVTLRELCTLGIKLDIARGLPVMHVNFFGYDDQAHRRGPSSHFAYWSLPGIDACVKRISSAAANALNREYDVWIYSDHGQEEVIPYAVENGCKMEAAVEKVFRELFPKEIFHIETADHKKGTGCRESKNPFRKHGPPVPAETKKSTAALAVAAQGPVGFIYFPRPLTEHERECAAEALVRNAHIPLVLIRGAQNQVFAFSAEGKFSLPSEAQNILGIHHPYGSTAAEELQNLARHSDSGDFVICGWRKNGKSISFPQEYGSHAGPGPHETDGFLLLPPHIHLPPPREKFLRPSDLRDAAFRFLSDDQKLFFPHDPSRKPHGELRVMTYNTHSCIGMDGRLSPERIARVIARHDPDVIALQELDLNRPRTRGMDQAKLIAELLKMHYHFHPVRLIEEEKYGNAVLSRYPIKLIRAAPLPRLHHHAFFEPRGALWVEIECFHTRVQLITVHLSLWKREQIIQAESLCSNEWLRHPDCRGPVILCGDFNAMPSSETCRLLSQRLQDAQTAAEPHRPLNTWCGYFPIGLIDHIFTTPNLKILRADVPSTRLEKLASDHLPLLADLQIGNASVSETVPSESSDVTSVTTR